MQHVATGCTGDIRECEEVWREWNRILYAKCVEEEGDRQLMSFTLKMSNLNVLVSLHICQYVE